MACHSDLSSLFVRDARAVWVLICSVGTPRSHFFSFSFFFFFSLLQVLHEFVFGIQPMFEFHPSLRLRQAKCFAAAACYYNLRDMLRISICICLEFRFFVKEKDVVSICWSGEAVFFPSLAYAISFFIRIRRLACEYFYFKVDIIGYTKIYFAEFLFAEATWKK